MTDAGGWAGLVAGAAALGLAAWSWAGRSPRARWWYRRDGFYPLVLGALPGMGLLLVVGSVYQLSDKSGLGLLTPFFLLGMVIVIVGTVHPSWWGPRWFRVSPGSGRRTRRGVVR